MAGIRTMNMAINNAAARVRTNAIYRHFLLHVMGQEGYTHSAAKTMWV